MAKKEGSRSLMVDRRLSILNQLKSDGAVRVEELSDKLGVCTNTIRRDLKTLEEEGILRRIHGGALSSGPNSGLTPFNERLGMNLEEKKRIAQTAKSLISNGKTIIIDAGTTMFELAKTLSSFTNLTVITNSIEIGNYILAKMPNITLIFSGGMVLEESRCMIGIPAENFFSNIHADITFLATRAISIKDGCTNQNLQEIPVKQKMVGAGKKIVVLADSSKFGEVALSKICSMEKVHTLVTEENIPAEQLDAFTNLGINILVAPK